ncbi:T9SS C-terminal target domain-containing protein [Pontibacter chitinilyticus]|uniref:T9SS C-terminal target domain-containing protein n=1 Tax=Pontibacter chitinilyticus TaxID=2674989 RepID=UPI0032194D39
MTKTTPSYYQNFDELPARDTAIWANNTAYMPGWYIQRTKSTNIIVANAGNSNTGGLYSYGLTNAKDRALGSISSLKAGEFAYGLLLQNTTGDTIKLLDISYYGEQWRISNSTAGQHQIAFYYAVSSSSTSFNLSPSSDKGWTEVPELNFKGPHFKVAGGQLNGNAADNRRFVAASVPVSIPAGAYIMLRWKDADELEADHGLAIDDFSLTWSVSTNQPVTVLPVELVSFTAKLKADLVELAWQTASEKESDHYDVERSIGNSLFEPIGRVAGKGTTAQVSDYTFTDEQPQPGTSYYRLKQTDTDGSYTYSAVATVVRAATESIVRVYPTMAEQFLEVDTGGQIEQQAMVLDMLGRQVMVQRLPETTSHYTLNVASLRGGTYVLVLLNAAGRRSSSRFMKR